MSGLVIVNGNLKSFRRSRPSRFPMVPNGAQQARARASAAKRTLAGEHRSAIRSGPDGRRSGNFPLVSSELSPPASIRSLDDSFMNRCKRGSGRKAGAAICVTAGRLQRSGLPDSLAQSPELEALTLQPTLPDRWKWLKRFSAYPQPMEQHREFSRHRRHRALLGCATGPRALQRPTP